MFEFIYAKKIKKDVVMEIIDTCKDNYYIYITYKPNGTLKIFIEMLESMYAKKIKKDVVMEIIDKYKDNYYINITHKPNGTLEIFIGNKREES